MVTDRVVMPEGLASGMVRLLESRLPANYRQYVQVINALQLEESVSTVWLRQAVDILVGFSVQEVAELVDSVAEVYAYPTLENLTSVLALSDGSPVVKLNDEWRSLALQVLSRAPFSRGGVLYKTIMESDSLNRRQLGVVFDSLSTFPYREVSALMPWLSDVLGQGVSAR